MKGYTGDVQVLTAEGYKTFSELEHHEYLLVPDIYNETLKRELCEIKIDEYSGEIYTVGDPIPQIKTTKEQRFIAKAPSMDRFKTFSHKSVSNKSTLGRLNFGMYRQKIFSMIFRSPELFTSNFDFCLGAFISVGLRLIKAPDKENRYLCVIVGKDNIIMFQKILETVSDTLKLNYGFRINDSGKKIKGLFWFDRSKEVDAIIHVDKINSLKFELNIMSEINKIGMYYGLMLSGPAPYRGRPIHVITTANPSVALLFETLSLMFGFESHENIRNSSGANSFVVSTFFESNQVHLYNEKKILKEKYDGPIFYTKTSTSYIVTRATQFSNSFITGE